MLAAFVIVLAASLGLYQPSGASPSPASLVMVDEIEPMDRGRVIPGQRASRLIRLRNSANSTVHLSIKNKSCGCLEPAFGKVELAPGEETTLVLAVIAIEAEGEQAHAADVKAESTPPGAVALEQVIRLGISYVPDVQFIARPTFISKSAFRGERIEFQVNIRSASDGPLPDVTVRISSEDQWGTPYLARSSDGRSLTIRITPSRADVSATGHLIVDGPSGSGRATIPLDVRRQDRLYLGPWKHEATSDDYSALLMAAATGKPFSAPPLVQAALSRTFPGASARLKKHEDGTWWLHTHLPPAAFDDPKPPVIQVSSTEGERWAEFPLPARKKPQ